jgi:ATP-dependent NAD(P)H-hydrate dehydratase
MLSSRRGVPLSGLSLGLNRGRSQSVPLRVSSHSAPRTNHHRTLATLQSAYLASLLQEPPLHPSPPPAPTDGASGPGHPASHWSHCHGPQAPHWKGHGATIVCLAGSCVYSGAPFLASVAALRAGGELAYVFTEGSAASALKAQSPDLVVNALWQGEINMDSPRNNFAPIVRSIVGSLGRAHALVVGPGIGRTDGALRVAADVISAAQEQGLTVVVDADALWLVAQRPGLVRGHHKTVLTPNATEFERLRAAVMNGTPPADVPPPRWHEDPARTRARALAEVTAVASALDGVVVLRKGQPDVVSDGVTTLEVGTAGSTKRPGGLGDILAGCAAAIACLGRPGSPGERQDTPWSLVSAAAGACEVVRAATHTAHTKHGRALIASDVLGEIGRAMAVSTPPPSPMH